MKYNLNIYKAVIIIWIINLLINLIDIFRLRIVSFNDPFKNSSKRSISKKRSLSFNKFIKLFANIAF